MPALRVVAAFVVAVAAVTGSARADGLPSKIDVRAATIGFFPYANKTLLAASGHVVVHEGRRTLIADALRIDLFKNRLLVTGHVRVTGGPAPIVAAAYALDLPTDRAIMLRTEPEPAIFDLRDEDFRSAVEQPAPAGAFDAVNLDGQRPYIRSRHAIVTPGAGVRMSPAEFPTGAGPSLTIPTYLYTLVANQHIAYSAAPYASFDQPYALFGSPAALTAAHLRYDQTDGVTVGIDTHLVDRDRAYFVASVLPLWDRRVDMLSFQQLRPGLQQQLSGSATFSAYPLDTLVYQLSESGKYTKETFTADQFNASNTQQIQIGTYEHDVGHYFGYELQGTYAHDDIFDGFPFSNDFRTNFDAEVLAPSFKLAGASFSTRYDYSNTLYDYPHQIATSTITLSAGRAISPAIRVFAQTQFEQNDDRYRDVAVGARALGLPDPLEPYYAPDGTPFPGYFAYAGANTYRSYELQTTFRDSKPDDQFQLTFVHTRDFPQFHGYGRAPLTASFDITRRLTPTIRVEVGRSYDFGWGGQYFTPQYTLGISP
jgi:hypothetical protein